MKALEVSSPEQDRPDAMRSGRSRKGPRTRTESKSSLEVDAYIARAPIEFRSKLVEVRRAIRAVAPDAVEVVSYRMPGYSYPGYAYKGMFAWFGVQRNHIGLYLRPPTIGDHPRELAGYTTTKSAVHLPLDRAIPTALIQRLVRASARIMKQRGD